MLLPLAAAAAVFFENLRWLWLWRWWCCCCLEEDEGKRWDEESGVAPAPKEVTVAGIGVVVAAKAKECFIVVAAALVGGSFSLLFFDFLRGCGGLTHCA